ncbi:phosphopantetheine-binding protein, partial [Serratia fonticola]
NFIKTLPLTINGKLDRKALPEPKLLSGVGYVPPRDELEAILCTIWQEVLGLERVGIHDNFFRIGGNSLLVMRILALINSRIAEVTSIGIEQFFTLQTISKIKSALDSGQSSKKAEPKKLRRSL